MCSTSTQCLTNSQQYRPPITNNWHLAHLVVGTQYDQKRLRTSDDLINRQIDISTRYRYMILTALVSRNSMV